MSNRNAVAASYISAGFNFQETPRLIGFTYNCGGNIKEENLLRVVSNGVDGDFAIEAKLLGQDFYETIFVGTGTLDTTLDISTLDQVRVRASSDLTTGTLAISGFVTPGDVTNVSNSGDATAVNQVVANDLLSGILQEVERDANCSEVPNLINFNISSANTIFSIVLPQTTRKISLRHREKGKLEFAFSPGLASFFTVPKGASYSEDNICLEGETIYFRSAKTGTLELIAWT